MKSKKKIAVIGCVNRDTVIRAGKPVIRGFGGILYNVFGLSKLLGERVEIVPVCNIGMDVSPAVFELLSSHANVSTEHMRVVDAANNHCTMSYRPDGERAEILTGFVPAISFEQVSRVLDADLALVNFISGRDMSLNTLKRFREEFSGQIYFDFHTLSLGLRRDGRRYLRRPTRWVEHLQCCDYLQLNTREFALLSGKPPDENALLDFFRTHIQPSGTAMLVTLGCDGAAMVDAGKEDIRVSFARSDSASTVADTTGAGDLFAAGFCAGLLTGRSLRSCLKIAVDAGTRGCAIIHPQDFQ